jgi:cellulose synthase/poly-beta-1,6-N-acetylglucosamine synthase-like glycosyltransferase
MQSFLWTLRTATGFALAYPVATMLLVLFLWCWDYPILLVYRLFQRAFGIDRHARDAGAAVLPVLVVIPSLLRQRDELESMFSTVRSIAENGYPGDLTIVLTIDGTDDAPSLYAELGDWVRKQNREFTGARLYVTGTKARRSKPMAIDHAMEFVKELVADGELPAFPPVYVSTDADADLGPHALERIVYRLQRRNRITGWPARVVAGALHVRGNSFWQGWRHFFTLAGQLNLQVAREYYVGNIWRYNIRWLPITGVPGAFYCTWSEIFLAIPGFLGYSRTLRFKHWLGWWFGIAPPKFSESVAPPLPELVAGDTDDTVTAYAATLARYQNGRFTFDPPRTPLHAFGQLLIGLFVDRALQYEPDAHVFTSSPTTAKTLFKQRKRWNSSRVELTGRFWPVLGYHWVLGLPVLMVKLLIARTIALGVIAFVMIPVMVWQMHPATGFVLGYMANILSFSCMTLLALLINHDFRYWRMALCLPLAPLYQIIFNWMPGTAGVLSDVLLTGNRTGFAPEKTLLQGGSARIALFFRFRRAVLLALRSVVVGDVPFGSFWFGWRANRFAPSGFEGWMTGKRRSIVPPVARWFRRTSELPDG